MPTGSQKRIWCGEEPFCCSLFEVHSKTSQKFSSHKSSTCAPRISFSIPLIPNPKTEFHSFLTVYNWAWGAIWRAVSQTPARDTGHDGSMFAGQRGRESDSWQASSCSTLLTWSVLAEEMELQLKIMEPLWNILWMKTPTLSLRQPKTNNT